MNKKFTINKLTKIAILAALSIVLRRFFTITIPVNKKIGIGYMPIILSGIFYGPWFGGLTGALADVVGMLINPDGIFHPGFTLSAFLMGFGPGLISFYFFNDKKPNSFILILFLFFLSFLNIAPKSVGFLFSVT